MRLPSPAFIIATLTALGTIGLIVLLFLLNSTPVTTGGANAGKTAASTGQNTTPPTASTMDLKRLGAIIARLDDKVEHPRKGFWRFTVEGIGVIVVGDDEHDRLRILVGIKNAKDLTQAQLIKITQTNFDTALDARYALSQDILWSVYVHPLKSLTGRQFISAIGQTVNLAVSYGDGYSSGGILFDSSDTKDAQRHQMIEKLITQGLDT